MLVSDVLRAIRIRKVIEALNSIDVIGLVIDNYCGIWLTGSRQQSLDSL